MSAWISLPAAPRGDARGRRAGGDLRLSEAPPPPGANVAQETPEAVRSFTNLPKGNAFELFVAAHLREAAGRRPFPRPRPRTPGRGRESGVGRASRPPITVVSNSLYCIQHRWTVSSVRVAVAAGGGAASH